MGYVKHRPKWEQENFTLPSMLDAGAGWNWHRCHSSHVSATHLVCAIACPQFRACYTYMYEPNGKNHCHRRVALFWIVTTGDDIIYVDTNHADCLHFWWGTKTSLPTGSAKIALVSICFYQSGPVFHRLMCLCTISIAIGKYDHSESDPVDHIASSERSLAASC